MAVGQPPLFYQSHAGTVFLARKGQGEGCVTTVKQNLDGSMPDAHTGRVLYDERSSFKRTALFVRAWGEARHSSGGTPTGQRDFGLGLYFYNARFYDPSRFISADTLIPNPGNVLDWDRFAAMRNNPLRYVDPSGRCAGDPNDPNNPDYDCWKQWARIQAEFRNVKLADARFWTLQQLTYVRTLHNSSESITKVEL
jgi:RHS repeat-associated protein